jgi:hypothetical protein
MITAGTLIFGLELKHNNLSSFLTADMWIYAKAGKQIESTSRYALEVIYVRLVLVYKL